MQTRVFGERPDAGADSSHEVMERKMRLRGVCLLCLLVLPFLAPSAHADTIGIGLAGPFAVLGAAGVTNTGPSVITGNLAGSTGTPAITGFPPGIVNGALLPLGAPANVFTAATTAYNFAAGQPFTQNLTGQNLGNMTLTPGVYFFATTAQLTGPLTLDAQGNNTAQWIFQIGTGLTTASASTVQVIGLGSGAFTGGITWAVGAQATLGTTTTFLGTIISNTGPVVLNTGATIGCGRAISLTKSVTLDTNVISNNCLVSAGTGGTGGTGGGTITPPPPVPEPSTFLFLATGLIGGAVRLRKLIARR